ncbi:MAG: hypothetical protein HeimC3_16100 [Candidatus Heimdallarchaeota archaeon LC_3]|nr:MAG: hypothetical protein HeimC3_16100 [Candidatus Heimdallarchaeota archaeon LC_3]
MLNNSLNRPFVEFLDLVIKIYEYRFANPDLCKAYKLSKREHFLKAQPIFLDVNNFFNTLSKETLKIFDLERDILSSPFSQDGIRHIIIKNNINFVELFDRIDYIKISLLENLKKFKSVLKESNKNYLFNDFFMKYRKIFLENLDFEKDFSFISTYQLILVYTHYVDSLVDPIEPVLPLLFHLLKEEFISGDKFSHGRFNELFSSNIRDFNKNSNKSFTIREFLTYLSEKVNKKDIPLFKKDTFSFQLRSHFKKSISFSSVLRNFLLNHFKNFANNDIQFNIHLLGLKYFIVELSSSAIIPPEIPDYVIVVEQFDELTILVLVCTVDDSKKIKDHFVRINQHIASRSLALYLLEDTFSSTMRKSVGVFPVVERIFKFHQAKNYLQKFKRIPKFYEDYILKWSTPRKLGFLFDKSLFQKKFDEVASLRSENVLNKIPDRIFFTNFPEPTPLIKKFKYLIIYCKIFQLKRKKVTKRHALKSIIEYSQVWADRLYLWETNDSVLLNCLIPFGWETFNINVKKLMQNKCESFIFLSKIVDLDDSKALKKRYSSQTFLPPLKTFDKASFNFKIKFPLLKDIRRDFKVE